ncbi:hypothetical protein GCM10009797_17720 [Nocardioides hwasunensis]
MSAWLGASFAVTAACAPGADTSSRAVARAPARGRDVRVMGPPGTWGVNNLMRFYPDTADPTLTGNGEGRDYSSTSPTRRYSAA